MLVGLSGKARSGKDTLFNIAQKEGWQKLSFAAALKHRAKQDFKLSDEEVDGLLKDQPCQKLDGHTPREFLIDLGNLYRKYDPEFWVKIVVRQAALAPLINWMVTDVRYTNEAKAIKGAGGYVFRIERHPGRDLMVDEATKKSISETSLDTFGEFDLKLPGFLNKEPKDLELFFREIRQYVGLTEDYPIRPLVLP